MSLHGKTLFITGASRGIGLAIALKAARDGANIAIAAKTAAPDPRLPGTIYTAAEEIESAGGKALAIPCDIRFEDQVMTAVEACVAHFGGLDICVNNASAIALSGTEETQMKRFDLMQQINARGTFLVSRTCIPHLKRSPNPHVLMLSPPLRFDPRWFAPHPAYTMAKIGMSLCVLGMAEEFKGQIAVNALWPRTAIATSAMRNILTGETGMAHCRKPEIVADAAWQVFNRPSSFSGNFLIDDTFLAENGVADFDQYRVDPACDLLPDFFVPDDMPPPPGVVVSKFATSLISGSKRTSIPERHQDQ
jgi:citronellol/citronellal dehydrogenase